MISPPHSNGAAALLLGDVGGQHAVAEHGVVQVHVAFLLLVHLHSNCCRSERGARQETGVHPVPGLKLDWAGRADHCFHSFKLLLSGDQNGRL